MKRSASGPAERPCQSGFSLLEMSLALVVAGSIVALIANMGFAAMRAQEGSRAAIDATNVIQAVRDAYRHEGFMDLTVANLMARAGARLAPHYVAPTPPATTGTLRIGGKVATVGRSDLSRYGASVMQGQMGEGFQVSIAGAEREQCLEIAAAVWDHVARIDLIQAGGNPVHMLYPGNPTTSLQNRADACGYARANNVANPTMVIHAN